MSTERINSTGIQLSEKNIFGSSQWYELTPLGSCLQGICSVQGYLERLSNNGMGDSKRKEWDQDIENRFYRAEELMGIQIRKSERNVLLEQYKAIANERVDSLTKQPTLVTKS